MHQHETESAKASGVVDESSGTDHLSAAKDLLAEDERKRKQACAQEIVNVLDRHGFALHVLPPELVLVTSAE